MTYRPEQLSPRKGANSTSLAVDLIELAVSPFGLHLEKGQKVTVTMNGTTSTFKVAKVKEYTYHTDLALVKQK